jgi:general secretion pathway protein E
VPSAPPPVSLRPADFNLDFVLDALVRAGLLTPAQSKEVLAAQISVRARLLRERGERVRRKTYEVSPVEIVASYAFPVQDRPGVVLDEEIVTEAIAVATGVRYQRIDPLKLDMKVIAHTLSGPFAERHVVLPLEWSRGALVVACANPFDRVLADNLSSLVGGPVELRLAAKSEILKAVDHAYGFNRSITAAVDAATSGPAIQNLEQLVTLASTNRELAADDRPVVAAVEYLLRYAFDQRASDIHIEPRRDGSLVRLRIDGVLHAVHNMPAAAHPPVVSRLKTLARMDIAEKRRPQDGRIKTVRAEREVELRMSTVPTAFGEKVVLRIFDPEVAVQDLSQLGFDPIERELFEGWIAHPHGMILVTGPTGSGKTTTLYAALKALAGPEVNVTTIEDPIEIVYEGFNQIQVQPKIDLDFATALRHILRQDPDIIMVGEVRDRETAQNAVQAALTGHLVLSTLHTNSAAEAVTRLADLGVTPFLIGGALLGVMAQRLVRTVCPHCAVPTHLAADEIAKLGVPLLESPNEGGLRKGKGCPRCRNTGYFGRSGIFEMLTADMDVRELIARGKASTEIEALARGRGMRSLREAAASKIAAGLTTLEEVLRVTTMG